MPNWNLKLSYAHELQSITKNPNTSIEIPKKVTQTTNINIWKFQQPKLI
jgi:hypothetical protein